MKKRAKKKTVARRRSNVGGLPYSHDAYGYIAVGFVFLVLVLILSGLHF